MARLVSRWICLAIWRFMRRVSLFSSFRSSQLPSPLYLPAPTLVHPPKSWFYLLHDPACRWTCSWDYDLCICICCPFPDRLLPFNRSRPSIIRRKKDPEATHRRAREKGYKANRVIVNNNAVLKKLKSQTERNYRRKLNL